MEVFDLPNDVRLLERSRVRVHGILAAPPCTVQSYARNRYPPTDAEILASLSVADACVRIAFAHRDTLAWWALENPRKQAQTVSRAGAVGVLPMGIRRSWAQTNVHLGRFRASSEDTETTNEADHLEDKARECQSD